MSSKKMPIYQNSLKISSWGAGMGKKVQIWGNYMVKSSLPS
jgi:hypothetical protein